MSNYLNLPFNRYRLLSLATLLVALWLAACSAIEPDFDAELDHLEREALKVLVGDIREFNDYKERPESDGPIDRQNNEAFIKENIPLFLSSSEDFTEVYNYRWWMISKHLRKWHDETEKRDYWVFTEFFGWPGHGSLSGAIPCPAGHQFYDVRWLRDPQYLRSFAEFYMGGFASTNDQRENRAFHSYISRPESHHFSSWMVNATEAFLKVHPGDEWRDKMLPHMEEHQQVWDKKFTVNSPGSKTDGLYKVLDLYDGNEFTISATLPLIASDGPYSIYTEEKWRDYYLGWRAIDRLRSSSWVKEHPDAFANAYPLMYLVRPSINSYYYGNLKSLGDLYALKAEKSGLDEDRAKSKEYQKRAVELKDQAFSTLWNQDDEFFYSYTAADNNHGVKDWESRVRESVGYTPWYFNMIPRATNQYDAAWAMLFSEKGFYNKKGMTTAEQQSPYYDEEAYAWNGRGWPFQNSVVNKAYANYLKNYKEEVTAPDRKALYDLVEKLVNMHGEQRNIGEWYIPSNGEQFGGVKDYFHSTFPDMLIEDLLGFTASHKDELSLQPLLPEDKWDYFYLGNIRYHDRDIDIIWKKDWDLNKDGEQGALCVWVDDQLVARSESLNDVLTVVLP